MRTMALEDEFGDVIRKARAGLGLSHVVVSQRAGLPAPELEKAERYLFVPDDETILCPGHGPLTTVGGEKMHNPLA